MSRSTVRRSARFEVTMVLEYLKSLSPAPHRHPAAGALRDAELREKARHAPAPDMADVRSRRAALLSVIPSFLHHAVDQPLRLLDGRFRGLLARDHLVHLGAE